MQEYSYPAKVRAAVLAAMNATQANVADLARLNSLLGELYADAVLATQQTFRVKAELVGCHGQTLYHQGEAQLFLGRKIVATWQTGEAAIIAARVGVPVVSDFSPGGHGRPGARARRSFPILTTYCFVIQRSERIVQNDWGNCKSDGDSRGGRC